MSTSAPTVGAEGLDVAGRDVLGGRDEQRLPGGEVAEQRALADARLRADRGGRGGGVPALGQARDRRVEQRADRALAALRLGTAVGVEVTPDSLT